MTATLESPWLGLSAYSEADREFFYGRNPETIELARRVRRETLTVLYGMSGLGKTSLLKAGLFPRLRKEDFLPVYIRLRHDVEPDGAQANDPRPTGRIGDLAEQVLCELCRAAAESGTECPEPHEGDSLWQYFHRAGNVFWSERQRLIVPILVLDQFEEVFTRGQTTSASMGRVEAFIDDLSALVENRTPASITAARMTGVATGYDNESTAVRVVLSLREDYLPHLAGLRSRFPTIRRNEMRLLPFTVSKALEVIERPGSDLLEPGVAQEIVRFVSAAPVAAVGTASMGDYAASIPDEPATREDAHSVEPALLSVVLEELNRLREDGGQITRALVAGQRNEILANFYERAFADVDPAVRLFIEKELITPAGDQRDSRAVEDALTRQGVTKGALDTLVDRRLLRYEDRAAGVSRIELSHDLLCGVVKAERARRLAAEAVDATEAVARDLRTRLRRSRQIAAGFAVLGLLALGLAIVSVIEIQTTRQAEKRAEHDKNRAEASVRQEKIARNEAEKAKTNAEAAEFRAKTARNEAEKLIDFMTFDLEEKMKQLGRLDLLKSVFQHVKDYDNAFPDPEESLENSQRRNYRYSAMRIREGDVQLANGNSSDALRTYRATLETASKLADQDRGNATWQRALSVIYERIGDVLRAQGDLAGALKSYQDEFEIVQRLADQDPASAQRQRDLSRSYGKLGDVFRDEGDSSHALQNYGDALKIAQKVVASDPASADGQRDISIVYQKVGDVLGSQGDLPGALRNYRDALNITQRLVNQDPGNAQWERDLLINYQKIGDALRVQQNLTGTLESYRNQLKIAEELAKKDPDNVDWQRGLSITYQKVGDVLFDQGDFSGALQTYRDGFEIAKRLCERSPDNAEWQRDLSISYEKLGDALGRQGDLVGALQKYRDRQAIVQRLVEKYPGKAEWQRDLFISYGKVGDLLSEKRDFAGAQKNYKQMLATAEELIKREPDDAQSRGLLAYAYFRMGALLSLGNSNLTEESREMLRKGREILQNLQRHKALTPQQQHWLDSINSALRTNEH